MDEEKIEPVWGLVANVVKERLHGEEGEIRSGTKHFVPGAKVYYHSAFWGMGAEQVTVTGRHRGSSKLVTVTMAQRHLHNWRAKLIYKPEVLKRFEANHYELKHPRFDDPETAAREQAEYFNRPSLDVRAIDKPMDLANDLINSWKADGQLGLDIFDYLAADRAMILYTKTSPIGVGMTTSAGQQACWIHPQYKRLLPFLERRLTATPTTNVSDETRLEYRSGLTSAAITRLSELMADEFDALQRAIDEKPDANNRNHLVRFTTKLLDAPEAGWPDLLQGHQNQLILAWTEGRAPNSTASLTGLSTEAVSAGFQVLKTSGLDLARIAAMVIKSERNLDQAQGAKLGALLQLSRLGTGTNSEQANQLTKVGIAEAEYRVAFGRVVASRLGAEFDEVGSGYEEFTTYVRSRASDWISRGAVDPSDELRVSWVRVFGTEGPSSKNFQIDRWPE